MKLFFVKWKKAVCLSMIIVLTLMGVKDVYCTAQVSEEQDEIRIIDHTLTISV